MSISSVIKERKMKPTKNERFQRLSVFYEFEFKEKDIQYQVLESKEAFYLLLSIPNEFTNDNKVLDLQEMSYLLGVDFDLNGYRLLVKPSNINSLFSRAFDSMTFRNRPKTDL